VTREIIDLCIKQALAANADYYLELFDRQSQSKKRLLAALSRGGKNIFSAEYIRKNQLTSGATVQRAVSELLETGVVEKNKDEYFITDPFFRYFIKNPERTVK
jgi:predicted transcriptional regulator